jgi:parallel beta-helix repeat protein
MPTSALLSTLVALLALAAFALAMPSATAMSATGSAAECHPAGTTGLTAEIIAHNGQTISGRVVNAAGCDIGIYVGPGAKGVTISGNVVTGANDHGIFVQDSANDWIVDNTVVGNGVLSATHSCNVVGPPCIAEDKAIQLSGTSSSTVAQNFVEGNSADGGIGVSDDGVAGDPGALLPGHNHVARGNHVVGNFIENNDLGCGIVVAGYDPGLGVQNTWLFNNTILGLSQAATGGYTGYDVGQIVVAADGPSTTVHNTWISGNVIDGSQLPGLVVHSNVPGDVISGTFVTYNTIGNNSGYPVAFSSPNTPTVPTGISIVAEAYGQPMAPTITDTWIAHNTVWDDMVGLWLCQSTGTMVHHLQTHDVTTARTTCSAGGS